MRNVFVLAGLALCMGAAAYAQTTGGWEQFHGTDGNNGRVAAGPDLRVYGTPRFQSAVPDYVDLWGFDPLATGPVVMDGRVFCYGSEGSVSAFDESTGVRLWNTVIDDGSALDSFASPSASNGKVYVGSDNTLYCMDAATGDILWTYAMGGAIVNASVTIAEDIGLCFLHAWRSSVTPHITRLHAVNIADGANAWTLDVQGEGQSHVAYNAAAGVVYTTVTDSGRGRIVAIDAVGGTIAWTSEGLFDKPCYGGIAFDAGLNWVVAAGDTGGSDAFCGLLVCDATTGATVRQTVDGLLPSGNYTPTIGTNGWIYGGGAAYNMDEGSFVFAYDPVANTVKWMTDGYDWDEYEGVTYGSYSASLSYAQDIGDGTSVVYAPTGSWGQWMDGIEEYAMFNAEDGTLLGSVPMTGGSTALANNNLYFINWDGDLVAFGPPVHIIEVDCGDNGAASTKRVGVVDGGSVTVTFTGDVRDVLVDGASVGVTNAHTLSSVTAGHTIRVEFFASSYTVTAIQSIGGSLDITGGDYATHTPLTVTATPQAGYVFDGWVTLPPGATVNGATATFAVNQDITLEAKFTAATWFNASGRRYEILPEELSVVSAGSYAAYIYGAETVGPPCWSVRGVVTVTVSASGRITAKAITQSGTVSFSATAWTGTDDDGNLTVSMTAKSGWTLNLNTSQSRIWGTAVDPDDNTLRIDGARQRFADRSDASAKSLLADVARYYTIQLSEPFNNTSATISTLPRGYGYLTLNANKNTGAVRIAGKLADGTSVSQSTILIPYISEEGISAAVPFFASIYSRKGSASGLFWLDPTGTGSATVVTDSDSGWCLRWENAKDGGFVGYLNAVGASYDNATVALNPAGYLLLAEPGDIPWYEANATAASGLLRWDALLRGIPAAINARGNGVALPKGTAPVLADGDYDYSAENSARATLSVKQSTGIFTGSFTGSLNVPQASGKARLRQSKASFAGVLLQNADGTVTLPGNGYATVNATGPAAKKLRLKHTFPVVLQPNP